MYSALVILRYQLPKTFAMYSSGKIFNDPDAPQYSRFGIMVHAGISFELLKSSVNTKLN